ncbi:MAG: type II toxin-antitoxin system HicB family antitoxin [archaeon]
MFSDDMKQLEKKFSAVITKEGKFFVSFCPELGVSSQGLTEKGALSNLKEAVELYLEDDPIGLPEKRHVVEFKAKVIAHA